MATEPADALRLRAFLPKAEGRPVIVATRDEWDRLDLNPGESIVFDVGRTALGKVASDATVVASVAQQFSTASGQISIYRDDPADAPTRINTDHYDVWLDLRSHQSFSQMVSSASTGINENMNSFLDQHVFFVKQAPGSDHRLKHLPTSVTGRLDHWDP